MDVDVDDQLMRLQRWPRRSPPRPVPQRHHILAHISQIKWIRIYMHDAIINSYDRCCEINNMRLDVYQTNKYRNMMEQVARALADAGAARSISYHRDESGYELRAALSIVGNNTKYLSGDL